MRSGGSHAALLQSSRQERGKIPLAVASLCRIIEDPVRRLDPIIERIEPRLLLAGAALDRSYGADGVATEQMGRLVDGRISLTVDHDGRAVVGVTVRVASRRRRYDAFEISRFIADGKPDTAFGGPAAGQPSSVPA